MKYIIQTLSLMLVVAFMLTPFQVESSSHREAPLISNDPLADNVDLYAFRSPDNPNTITLIATYVPMQLPHGGPNYYGFGENVRYEIHVDNDAGTPGDEIIYRFTFNIVHEDPSTFFYIRLGNQNNKRTYNLERSIDGGQTFETIVTDGYVPPNNIGPRSIESMVGLGADYNNLFADGTTIASTGESIFAGPTDDPFFVDLGGIFDLGNAPRQVGNPTDGLACYNVSALAIQVPIATLLKTGAPSSPDNILDPNYVIGVWASASRPAITTLSSDSNPTYSGDWVQVSRLGMPLTNEAVIPVGQKDFWNRISPYDEITETTLDEFFYNPELALYMDDDQFGAAVPAFAPLRIQTNSLGMFDFSNGGDGLFALKGSAAVAGTALDDAVFGNLLLPGAGKPRSVDLWPTFHTGVPNVIPYQLATGKNGNPLAAGKPFVNNFLPNGGDMLRLNMAVPATDRGDAAFSSLGLIQAAVLGLTTAPYNTNADIEFIPNMDGFPNGRRLEDDVTRIELQAVSGAVLAAIGLWYDDYEAGGSPVTQDMINVLSYTTGVESNDKAFRSSFPYLAQPHSGTGDCSGRIYEAPKDDEEVMIEKNLFVSSNTQGKIGVFGIQTNGELDTETFNSKALDADGVYYDDENDVLFQINRSANVIDVYSSVVANTSKGLLPVFEGSSSSNFGNGRELAVAGNKLVVAQDASAGNGQVNAFVIYNINGTDVSYDRTYESSINLWGIHLDGNTMFAIEDNSDNLVRYDNFFSRRPGTIVPSASITVDGIVRTHGLTYDRNSDLMILTDVGSGMVADDGAFVVVENYSMASADDSISMDEQIRIAGDQTELGNPVDVAVDTATNRIYIAERANEGGKVLVFNNPTGSGNEAPVISEAFAGASAVFIEGATEAFELASIADFFVSSNTTGMIGYTDVLEDRSGALSTFTSQAMDADGIYYDEENDVLYQLNRTDNVINAYSDVKASLNAGMTPSLTATSSSDFTNGREITVAGNFLVVAQDANAANNMQNKLVVYDITPTDIQLVSSHDVDINLWGIHADVNTLYAIVDNSNQLAVFDSFFLNGNGMVEPTRIVDVTGIVRTHGLTYDRASDLMILTDVGSGMVDDDGAFVTIANFTSAAADATISVSEMIRVEGDTTLLGNPVDVAFDANNDAIYITERAKNGGMILMFDNPEMSGAMVPFEVLPFAGASGIYLTGAAEEANPTTSIIEVNGESISFEIAPNPAKDWLNIDVQGKINLVGNATIEIYNLSGQLAKSLPYNSSVAVSELNPGSYTIIVKNNDFSYQEKFIKL